MDKTHGTTTSVPLTPEIYLKLFSRIPLKQNEESREVVISTISSEALGDLQLAKDHSLNSEQLLYYPEERKNTQIPHIFNQNAHVFYDHISGFQKLNIGYFLGCEHNYADMGLSPAQIVEVRQKVVQRIDEIFKAVPFEKRWLQVNGSVRNEIKIMDLEMPWTESGFKIALMTDKEFDSLTLEQIDKLSPRQMDLFRKRFVAPPEPQSSTNTLYSVSLTLSQFCLLHPDEINKNLSIIPLKLFAFLQDAQIKDLDILSLSHNSFKLLFEKDPKRIAVLSLDQLYNGLDKFNENSIRLISKGQLKQFDLEKLPAPLFNALFPEVTLISDRYSFIQDLKLEQIYDHLDKFYGNSTE